MKATTKRTIVFFAAAAAAAALARRSGPVRLPAIGSTPIGLGDAVRNITSAAGVSPTSGCGCAARQATLNNWARFG